MTDNNRNDFDFIRDKFDKDGIKAPESLSAGNIKSMLEDAPAGRAKPLYKRGWFRPALAAAACVVLVIGLVPFMRNTDKAEPGELIYYSSYDQIEDAVREMTEESTTGIVPNGTVPLYSEDAELADSDMSAAQGAVPKEYSVSGEGSHSETYTQEEDVDEADIVKTDGKYIYFVSYMENQIIIAKASEGKASRVSAINAGQTGSFIHDMYIRNGKLIVIASDDSIKGPFSSGYRGLTKVTVFDVTDPADPEKLSSYSQTGNLLSSRMTGDTVCLITNDFIWSYKKGDCVPYVCYGKSDPEKLPVEDICGIPRVRSSAYTVIGCLDTESGKADSTTVRTKAILGGSEEIYCSSSNLYVTSAMYDDKADSELTCILKVSIKDGKVRYGKMATVNGYVNNQFSMGESGGYFKIATTDYVNDSDVNNLFILDKNMDQVGSVRNFARDEHIEAVRFIKDKAYVITYEQTDPLFIIDLKDPAEPVIEGHVKISGFSTLLVPADKDHLLGFGFSTDTTEFGEATDGVKLALFDISDPSSPKVADEKEFSGMYSEIQDNHKALLVGPDASYYAFPYSVWDDGNGDDENGILMFSAGSGKITDQQKLKTKEAVNRCIYIDDYIYGICDDDSIEGFNIR